MGSYGNSDSGPSIQLISGALAIVIAGALALVVALLASDTFGALYVEEVLLILSGLAFVVGLVLLLRAPRTSKKCRRISY